MNVRAATETDFKAMGERSVSRGCLGQVPETTDFVYALEHDGELLAVGGIKQMNPTCAWAWIDLAAQALENQIAVYRIIRDYLDVLMRDKGLTRLMAAIEDDFPEAVRMAQHLGFVKESRMRCFFGGKDGIMYVRLSSGLEAQEQEK